VRGLRPRHLVNLEINQEWHPDVTENRCIIIVNECVFFQCDVFHEMVGSVDVKTFWIYSLEEYFFGKKLEKIRSRFLCLIGRLSTSVRLPNKQSDGD